MNTSFEYEVQALEENLSEAGIVLDSAPVSTYPNLMDEISVLSHNLRASVLRNGDIVEAENKDGSTHKPPVDTVLRGGRARDFRVKARTSLYEYWDQEIQENEIVVNVSNGYSYPASKVIYHLDSIGGLDSEEKGMLAEAGYTTKLDLIWADESTIADTWGLRLETAKDIKYQIGNPEEYADDIQAMLKMVAENDPILLKRDDLHYIGKGRDCSQCGETFIDSEGGVEGDGGEWYCSINCLNESYT